VSRGWSMVSLSVGRDSTWVCRSQIGVVGAWVKVCSGGMESHFRRAMSDDLKRRSRYEKGVDGVRRAVYSCRCVHSHMYLSLRFLHTAVECACRVKSDQRRPASAVIGRALVYSRRGRFPPQHPPCEKGSAIDSKLKGEIRYNASFHAASCNQTREAAHATHGGLHACLLRVESFRYIARVSGYTA
jgi:hypothetical protein